MARRSARTVAIVAVAFAACVDVSELSSDDAGGDGTDAATDAATTGDVGADVTSSGADGGEKADVAVSDAQLDVIDPFDAPDGWEASGPPPPPTCTQSGFRCATTAPNGWTGPFGLYNGNVTDAPSCGTVTQLLAANASLSQPVPAAQCPACTCNKATGTSCGQVTTYGSTGGCAGKGSTYVLDVNVCQNVPYGYLLDPGNFAANGIGFEASKVMGGSCTPTAAKPSAVKPAFGWDVAAVGCTTLVPKTPGCNAGTVCSAIPAPPFDSKLCVAKDGDVAACPGAPYSRRMLFYKGASDSRDCGTCACGAVPSANCNATAITSDQSDCTPSFSGTVPTCLAHTGYYYTKVNATPPPLDCPASGGAPTGTVTPASPVTVCCEP